MRSLKRFMLWEITLVEIQFDKLYKKITYSYAHFKHKAKLGPHRYNLSRKFFRRPGCAPKFYVDGFVVFVDNEAHVYTDK